MRKGLDIRDLAAKIEHNRELKRDFIAPTQTTTMQVVDKVPVLELERVGSFPIWDQAHDQIATKLNIPAKYYDRMRTEAPDLLATNVNAWFRKEPELRLVRTLDGEVRSFNSNKYQRIEHEEIAEVVLPILAEMPGVEIVASEITNSRMYIQAVMRSTTALVKVGDLVEAGL